MLSPHEFAIPESVCHPKSSHPSTRVPVGREQTRPPTCVETLLFQ
jgi:hypothetical protein